ncbi:MAG: hypothetical protein O3A00_05705 [Planctomycetota bacterium]|nr:hypothetical protein [Planctomycetota bacterium]
MRTLWTTIGFMLFATTTQAADIFDLHTTYWLQQVAKDNKPVTSLAMEQAVRLKGLDPTQSSPCLAIKTNDGNWTKALVGFGFRRGPDDKPFPVLLIERYVTYRADRDGATSANGQDVILFAGFSFNFDIGQVVPEGQGGDIRFTAKSEIQAVDNAQLYGMNGSQLPAPEVGSKPDPRNRAGVLATDFAGTWKINADGRWQGELRLNVENNGRSHGTYTSDESKSRYDVTGRMSGSPHHMKLQLHLDNATQTFDAFLWTKDKSAMAGTTVLAERTFGFFATRVIEGKTRP